jgi:DNA-binding CsgD family transcriptional regulator
MQEVESMGDNDRLQEMFAEFLKNINSLTIHQIMAALNTELSDKTRKIVYELSNGENTTRDIAKVAGISISTITSHWKHGP